MVIRFDKKAQAVLCSYARAAVAAGLAVYIAGEHNVRGILSAAVSALVPPALRWANKNDTAFGRGSN